MLCSSRELSELVDAKERELIEIRSAAADAAAEEGRTKEERLKELRDDFEHNLRVLCQRDVEIERLREDIANSERQQAADVEEIERRMADNVKDLAANIRSEVEGEFNAERQLMREELDREYSRDMRLRALEMERKIRSEIFESLSTEIGTKDQMIASLEEALAEGDADGIEQKHIMEERIKYLERVHKEIFKVAEASWRSCEIQLKRQLSVLEEANEEVTLKLRASMTEMERLNNYYDEQISKVENENKSLLTELSSRGDNASRLQVLVAENEGKITELLNTILILEDAIMQKDIEREENENKLVSTIEMKNNNLEMVKEDATGLIVELESRIKGMNEEINRGERRWSETERELRAELGNLIKSKELSEEATRKELKEKHLAASEFQINIRRLKSERDCQETEVQRLEELIQEQKHALAQACKKHNDEITCCKNTWRATCELNLKKEEEVNELSAISNHWLRRAEEERDKARKEKDIALKKIGDLEQDSSKLGSRLSHIEQKEGSISGKYSPKKGREYSFTDGSVDWPNNATEDICETPSSPNLSLPQNKYFINNDIEKKSLRTENDRLKAMVGMMRAEMERLTLIESSTVIRGKENTDTSTEAQKIDKNNDADQCPSSPLEEQLFMCRKYLDLFLLGRYENDRKQSNGELQFLRQSYGELNHLIDNLRQENRR